MPPLERFHGVIAWHSFFHLTPDAQEKMFETFSSLCRPGAPLMFTSGTEHGEMIGTFAGKPLYHGRLDSDLYGHLLDSHGFEVIQHVEHDASCGGATIWLARRTPAA